MSLTLIIGCMFSGKTTELLRRVNRHRAVGQRVVVINHSIDNRYNSTGIVTHDNYTVNSIKCNTLKEVDESLVLKEEYDVIAIDEGQFFKDLELYVKLFVEEYGKSVLIAGLTGDYKREKFGHILDLIPFATHIQHTKALCVQCKDGTEASFTLRICDSNKQIDVGAVDKYKAVCRVCYLQLNTSH